MSWDSGEGRRRRRERVILSLLSLFILFGLLGGYVLLHATQDQEGKLSLISTSQVTISIGGEPEPAQPATASTEPPATTTPQRPSASGRGPGLVTEVLSGNDQADASALSRNGNSSGSSNAGGSSQPAPATATRASGTTSNTGVLPPSLSIGSTGPGGSGGTAGGAGTGNSLPPATSTTSAGGGGATATLVPQATATAAAAAASATTAPPATAVPATPVPTAAPRAPTATSVPETVFAPGHHSHLHMDGFVGPGAYKSGGIIVSNVGPVAFNYSVSMTVSGDAALASQLRLRIYLRVGSLCDYPGQPPAPASSLLALTGDQVGSVLYDGAFTTGNELGDPTVEVAAGDRHLDPGQSEILCMEVFFPWTSGNQFQGLTVSGTQIFTAKSPDH